MHGVVRFFVKVGDFFRGRFWEGVNGRNLLSCGSVLTYTVPNILRKDDREWLLDNNAWKTNPFGIQIHEFTYTKRQ